MLKYIVNRIIRSIITLVVVLFIVFLLLRLMPIEGYFSNYERMTPTQVSVGLAKLGLDKPLYKQFLDYLYNILHGDFGLSQRYRINTPISEIIIPKLMLSLQIGVWAIVFGLFFGISFGAFMAKSARKRDGYQLGDRLGFTFLSIIDAIPPTIYYLFIQVLGTELINKFTPLPTLFYYDYPLTWILPVFSLSIGTAIWYAIWLRRYMIDESTKGYVQLAYAKGCSDYAVSLHIFRNAIVPMSQNLPVSFISILMGSIYVESRYSIPGLGCLLVDAIKYRDNLLVQALVLLYASLNILGLMLGDLLMILLDSRVQFAVKKDRK